MTLFLLACFVGVTTFTYWLRYLNLCHLKKHGATVPDGFSAAINEQTLARSTAYTLDSSRLELWASLFNNSLLVLFFFAGLLPIYDRFIGGLTDSPINRGVFFFVLLSWLQTLLGLPFSYYGTFTIEARHGFNATTKRLWITDLLKTQFIGSLLLACVVYSVFWLIQWSPQRWWIWVWAFMAFFGLFMMFISPYLIEPLFNRFEPVSETGLQEEIAAMMAKAGLKVGSVMQMDASRRSRHSNAYFTGLGKVKRIVLFDTLLSQMTHREIVAVLAHEIGHWKLRHILKRVVVTELAMFVGSLAAFKMIQWPSLPQLFGLQTASLPASMVLLGFIASMLLFPLTPVSSWFSRRHERDADRFAWQVTGDADSLASALIKLSAENLSNLYPHPFYARFYYSHPPVVERVHILREWAASTRSVSTEGALD